MSKITDTSKQKLAASLKTRIIAEKAEIDETIAEYEESLRVSTLKNNASKNGLDDTTVLDLVNQIVTMKEYSAALQRRLGRF